MISDFQNKYFTKILCLILIAFIIFNSSELSYAAIYSSVSGSVVDKGGKAVTSCKIILYDKTNSKIINFTLTDINGNYFIENIPAGTYGIDAIPPSPYIQGVISKEIVINGESNISDLTFFAKLGGGISGVIYHEDSVTPYEGVFLRVVSPNGEIAYAQTNKNGEYIVNGLSQTDSCKIYLNVKGKTNNLYENIKILNGEIISHVNFIFRDTNGYYISGRLKSDVKAKIDKIRIAIVPVGSNEIYGYSDTDEVGNFKIDGLQGGNYRIIVYTKIFKYIEIVQNISANISNFEISIDEPNSMIYKSSYSALNSDDSDQSYIKWATCVISCVLGGGSELCSYAYYCALISCPAAHVPIAFYACIISLLASAGCIGVCIDQCSDEWPCR